MKRFRPWIMVFFGGFCLRTGISSISPVLELIRADLFLSSALLSLLTAIPVVCMGILSPIGHIVNSKLGMRNAMALSLAILAGSLAARFMPFGATSLLFTAFFVGVADAIIRPLLSGYIKEAFPSKTEAAMGFYATSMGVGSAAAAFLTLPASTYTGLSWGAGLAVWSIPAACGCLFWLAWAPRRLPAGETLGAETACAPISAKIKILLTVFFGMQAGINYALIAWFPALATSQGTGGTTSTLIVGAFVLVQTATSLFSHAVIKAFGWEIRGALITSVLVTVVGSGSLLAVGSAPLVPAIILGVATGMLFPQALTLPLTFTGNSRSAIQLSGITQAGGYIIGGAIPWIVGIFVDTLDNYWGVLSVMFCSTIILASVAAAIGRQPVPSVAPNKNFPRVPVDKAA